MCFRPDNSAPQAFHLEPGTIGNFYYMIIIKDALKEGQINVDFFEDCSGMPGEGEK